MGKAKLTLMLILALSVSGEAMAESQDSQPKVSWWKGEESSLTINGQRFEFKDWLVVVKGRGDDICAVQFNSFPGIDETVHLYRGKATSGHAELAHTRRLSGDMNSTPQLDIYDGASLMVKRFTVTGDKVPRSMLLTPFDSADTRRRLTKVREACAS
jgi:hypothetical protein